MPKIFFLLLCIPFSIFAQAADVYVATNKSNEATINQQLVLKILKAERLTWENGNSVVLMIDDLQNTDAKLFDEVLDMSKSQFIEYWRIKFFSGRALIPKQIKNINNAQAILAENKNGIYISIGKVMDKMLTEDPDIKVIQLKY